MINLTGLFNQLEFDDHQEHQYSAVAIPDFESHRIAKDKTGNPALLISNLKGQKNVNSPNVKLHNVEVFYNINCVVKQNNQVFKKEFTLVSFVGSDGVLKNHFLKLCSQLVLHLGNDPSENEISKEITHFIELFRLATQPQLKTFQGLWAELFVIAEAADPPSLVNCWHSIPEEKYDFNNGEDRIEVKSSANSSRCHNFSIEQLHPPFESKAIVVSIFVKLASVGKSIQTLQSEIEMKLTGESDLIEKLRLQIAVTLGSAISEIDRLKFDWHYAKASMRFFDTDDIPKIHFNNVPEMVSEVRFKSDLSHVPNIPLPKLKTLGGIYIAF